LPRKEPNSFSLACCIEEVEDLKLKIYNFEATFGEKVFVAKNGPKGTFEAKHL
jgi:hypothetical protein